jgi:glucose-6-phosphate isomerase
MQLPDEAITYSCQGLFTSPSEEWTPAAELRSRYLVPPGRFKELAPRLLQCRSQVAAEREMRSVPAEMQPLHAGFIDLPQATLDQHRRRGEASELGRTLSLASRLREQAGRVVILGGGGACLGGRALVEALRSAYHNELPAETRLGDPRLYFAGDNVDNDGLQELLDVLQITCVEPENREERWAVVCVSQAGADFESAVALRVFRREAAEYYGLRSPLHNQLFAGVTGVTSRLRELLLAQGHDDATILTIPDNVGERFGVFSPAGLLPAAIAGLDVRALLLGAAAMTKRFLEDPFERNPVLQFAAANHLMSAEMDNPVRVLSVWSSKLAGAGLWYEHLLAEGLAKQGRGPAPLTAVQTRDFYSRGQLQQQGPRQQFVNNLVVRNPRSVPLLVQMADHNQDELNGYARRGLPDLMGAALRGSYRAAQDAARPSAELVLPALSEHTMGQLLQMLMLATVVEARLMGVNPYSHPGAEAGRRLLREALEAEPDRSGTAEHG